MTVSLVGCGDEPQNNDSKPIINLSLERQTLYDSNESIQLVWGIEDATSVVIDNVELTASQEVTTYTVKATGDGGLTENQSSSISYRIWRLN